MKRNTIYNEDFLKNNLPDECIDLIVTDPPYKVITGGAQDGKTQKRPRGILGDYGKLFEYESVPIPEMMQEMYRILKPGTHCYVFTNTLNLTEMLVESQQAGFKLHNLLVWEKNNCLPNKWYMKNCEYVLLLRKGKAKNINDVGGSKTVHQFNNILGNKLHPCEKPLDLLSYYIKNSSNKGDLVCDPFAGSGSTLLAARATGRKYIGYEIDSQWFGVAEDLLGG